MNDSRPLEVEWSEFFDVTHIKDSGNHINIEASQEQRQNLARRFGIVSIENLTAKLHLKQEKPNQFIKITGPFEATITQNCVITAEPVTTTITENLESWYANPDQIVSLEKARREKAIKDGEEIPMLEEHEDPEPFNEGFIDLGELVAQHLSLSIPPYPRADGAEYDGPILDAGEQEPAFDNPFAKLAEWKDKLGDKK